MWLFLLLIAFVTTYLLVYFRTPEGTEQAEGYEWLVKPRSHGWIRRKKKKKK